MSGPLDIARGAWGDDLPDWVETLAIQCSLTSQNQVAKKIGRSPGAVSQILNRKYGAGYGTIEERVRGVFQEQTVLCPSLGQMPLQTCQDWRAKARAFQLGNPLRARMYRACHKCPRNQKEAGIQKEIGNPKEPVT